MINIPIKAKRPITKEEYSNGGDESKKDIVVQNEVKIELMMKLMRHAWTNNGSVKNIWRILHIIWNQFRPPGFLDG